MMLHTVSLASYVLIFPILTLYTPSSLKGSKYLAHPNFLIIYKCESHVGWIIQLRLDLHHQLLDPEVELLVNPAIWMTWSDEDFIGRICRLCRKTHVLSSPQRTIDRALSLYRKQFASHFDLAYLQPIPENQAWKDVLHWFWSGRGWSGQSVSAVVSGWVIDGIMGEPIVNFFWNRQLIGRWAMGNPGID